MPRRTPCRPASRRSKLAIVRGALRLGLGFGLLACGAAVASHAADVAPDPKLRATRNTYHPAVDALQAAAVRLSDEQMDRLKGFPLEAVWQAVQGLGYTNCHYSGLQTTRPGERLVGRALTIRYLPRRPDLVEAMQTLAKEGDWPIAYNVRAGEEARPGDVLVVDLGGGVPDGIFFGDISALAAQLAGSRGVVLYGSTRDLTELREMAGFPVLAVGFDPRPATQIGVDWNVPVRVGGATVLPGDAVVADDEAVVFFPAKIADQVIERATRTVEQERYERELVRGKQHRFRDVYPLNPELRKKFEEEKKGKP
jgi:regulator of RNase E activity RraA